MTLFCPTEAMFVPSAKGKDTRYKPPPLLLLLLRNAGVITAGGDTTTAGTDGWPRDAQAVQLDKGDDNIAPGVVVTSLPASSIFAHTSLFSLPSPKKTSNFCVPCKNICLVFVSCTLNDNNYQIFNATTYSTIKS